MAVLTETTTIVKSSLSRWHSRPVYHLRPPQGWMNDPCAPGFDPATGTYHLFYQWNPESCEWGEICWGHFTSCDGIVWEHNGEGPVLEPTAAYDKLGIFTGCMWPTGPHGEKGKMSLLYSSVTELPIHWTIPYVRNCVGLSLASSSDGGQTWEKDQSNPILKGEPEGLTVTGFRDPYLSDWKRLSRILGRPNNTLYGVHSGGVVNQGPNAFIHWVAPDDLTTWSYLGLLLEPGPSALPGPSRWSGDLGVNWECLNFMTLGDGREEYDVLTFGSEGGIGALPGKNGEPCVGVWTLWLAGRIRQTNDAVRMQPEFSGILDHGNLYAPNTYQHFSGARIAWGWIKEDELPLPRLKERGWSGYLSLPRQIFLQRTSNVVRTLRTPLERIPSFKVSRDAAGTASVHTIGIKPLAALSAQRRSPPLLWSNLGDMESGRTRRLGVTRSAHWEVEAVVRVDSGLQKVGFHIRHSPDLSLRTTISFSIEAEQIVVDRSQSNLEPEIGKHDITGPFTLFVQNENGEEQTEKLHLRIFSDGDVLEVFANDRFALSTVAYSDATTCSGISCFSEHDDGYQAAEGEFESVKLWDNLSPKELVGEGRVKNLL